LRGFAAAETARVRFAAVVVLRFGESDSFVRIALADPPSIVHLIVHDECNALVTEFCRACDARMGSMRVYGRNPSIGLAGPMVSASNYSLPKASPQGLIKTSMRLGP
jgi:hypothetical protein